MRRQYVIPIVIVLLLVSFVASCNSGTPPPEVAPEAAPDAAPAPQLEAFDPNRFDQPTEIDNMWMPMKPGTRYIYEGTTVEDDGTVVPHRIEINITDLTKEIGGVRSVATWDLDYSNGQLVEAELAFFAQDKDDNVWRMGEYPEEYEDGKFLAAPSWIHGLQEAQAGIMMQGEPKEGTPSYAQGWGPAVGWTDRGLVDQMGQKTCVPAGCYENVLIIAETSASEPDAQQLKHYAPQVGNVSVGWRGSGEKTKETLELVEVVTLDEAAMAEVRSEALKLEAHGYEVSKEVYALTPPLEGPPGIELTRPAASEAQQPAAPVAQSSLQEVVIYASELPESALYEFEVWEDPASPGGTLLGVANTGQALDSPPENEPNVTFTAQVEEAVPYRCWIHMKVGAASGASTANLVWVQFTDAADKDDNEVFAIGSDSFLTAQGPTQEGWAWVECTPDGTPSSQPLLYFSTMGEITVRLQAGMEGVGFDQFVLSAGQFLENPPSEAVVKK